MLNYLWAVVCFGIEGSMVLATDCMASYSEFCCSHYCMYLILMYIVAEYESMFINVVYTSNDWALYIH